MAVIHLRLFLIFLVPLVRGHGRMLEPPARNSMWRFGYPNPTNYDDDSLFCGGKTVQHQQNNGRCGVCGDGYQEETRDHEVSGQYYNNIIVRTYKPATVIDLSLELVTNHYGWFEFKICPYESIPPTKEVSQECLNKTVLELADGSGTRWEIPRTAAQNNVSFKIKVQLPADLTCDHCVLQWHWVTGNFWEECGNGTGALGCGEQEEYANCADVRIKNIKYNKIGFYPGHVYVKTATDNYVTSGQDNNALYNFPQPIPSLAHTYNALRMRSHPFAQRSLHPKLHSRNIDY